MTVERASRGVGPESLGRLRLRLTAWYVGTFLGILSLIGIGLFAEVTSRFDADLDASLRVSAHKLAETVQSRGAVSGAMTLLIPDRRLIVFDTTGAALTGIAEPWVSDLVRAAVASGAQSRNHHRADDQVFRAYAFPFAFPDGTRRVAVAVADEIEVEDKYASVIGMTIAAAVVALILVAAGGWIVTRKSMEPVELAMMHMRRFMADAAHELRTPLSVIRTRAEVALRRSREPDDYAVVLRAIEQESSRVTRIVEDLLMLARADAGERPIERARVFLDDVALDAAEGVRTLAERAGVPLAVERFDEAVVVGDAVLLRRLVVILLDNAIKFSRHGGEVRVGVRVTRGGAVLTVADTGVGIADEHLSHVFERFYRGDAARTRSAAGASEGVGLGLSIAQWIVQEHGATVRIDSKVGEGTRVTVTFPPVTTEGPMSEGMPGGTAPMRTTPPRAPVPE
jgi:signal transduction histidine kinase